MSGSQRRRTLAVAAVAIAIVTAAAALWRRPATVDGKTAAPAASGASATRSFQLQWPRGTTYTYSFRWKGDSHVALPGEQDAVPFEATYDIDGDLTLRSLGKKSDVTLLAAELVKVGHHVFRALGKDLVPADDEGSRVLEHHTAWLEMGPDGVVRTIWFKSDDGDAWKIVAQSLLGHLTITIPDATSLEWVASEHTSAGRAATTYAWMGDAAPLTLKRARTRYDELAMVPNGSCDGCQQKVRALAEIHLDPAGHLRTIDDDETLAVVREATKPGTAIDIHAHDAFHLELRSVGTFDAPTAFELDRTRLEARRPGVPAVSGDPSRAMLEQRVAGLTWDQLSAGITVAAVRGSPEPGLVSRASALLVQHPENAAKLVAVFLDGSTKPRARALIVDILASAGTPEAQAAMREALGSAVAKADPSYQLLVQRFTLLSKPDAKSAEFIASTYDASKARGDDGLRFASAYALGSMAGELTKQGDDVSARSYDAKLVGDLSRAKTAKEKGVLLGAIGAEGRKENVKLFSGYATDTDPGIRAAVAGGLRSIDGPDVRSVLFDLLGDSDGVVKAAALSSLEQRPIGADDIHRVSEVIKSGTTGDLDSALVGFLANHASAGPEVRPALLALLARAQDPQLQARIRYVLSQMPSP